MHLNFSLYSCIELSTFFIFETLENAVMQPAAGEVEAGVAARDGGPKTTNQKIWTIIDRGQELVGLLQHHR